MAVRHEVFTGGWTRRPLLAAAAAAVALCAVGVSGCSVISKIKTAVDTAEHNKATMDAFTQKIQSGPTTFQATYVTTGSSPTKIVYAVQAPNGVAFKDTPAKSGNQSDNFDLVVNHSGAYSCTPTSPGSSSIACNQYPKLSDADYANVLDFYTPQHWVTFLRDFALAAGIAGDKVTTSSKSVNGFNMSCVDFTPPGEGTSTVCTTAQHILGYVKVTGDSTSFEIKSYSTSPSSSLFQVPSGAKVTKVTIPSGSVTSTTS